MESVILPLKTNRRVCWNMTTDDKLTTSATVSETVCCVVAISVPSGKSEVTVMTLVFITSEHDDGPEVAQLIIVSSVVVIYIVVFCVLVSVVVYVTMHSDAGSPDAIQARMVEVTWETVV